MQSTGRNAQELLEQISSLIAENTNDIFDDGEFGNTLSEMAVPLSEQNARLVLEYMGKLLAEIALDNTANEKQPSEQTDNSLPKTGLVRENARIVLTQSDIRPQEGNDHQGGYTEPYLGYSENGETYVTHEDSGSTGSTDEEVLDYADRLAKIDRCIAKIETLTQSFEQKQAIIESGMAAAVSENLKAARAHEVSQSLPEDNLLPPKAVTPANIVGSAQPEAIASIPPANLASSKPEEPAQIGTFTPPEPMQSAQQPEVMQKNPEEPEQGSKALSLIFGTGFYVVLVLAVLLTILVGGSSNKPKTLLGFSMFTVLTGSMQSEIPQNSFILTKRVNPSKLAIGDDITYLKEGDVTVTHRIVGIFDNFEGSGSKGFETKGVDNPSKDAEVVYSENVVGKVIFHNYMVGVVVKFVKANWKWVGLLAILTLATLYAIAQIFKNDTEETGKKPRKIRNRKRKPKTTETGN